MSKSAGKKTRVEGKGSPLLVGLLLGLIIGAGLAAGLAWYLMKSPSPFISKDSNALNPEQVEKEVKAAAAVVQQSAPPGVAASGVDDGKPRFEFYKVLTDKQDTSNLPKQSGGSAPSANAPTTSSPAPADKTMYYLQAGAFSNAADADKLKASLIFDGMEVTTSTVNTPDKGTLYKVRVGPYQNVDEMSKARAKLQLKGINSTPVRG